MKAKMIGSRWVAKIDRGEEATAALTAFAAEHGISAGSVSGIGALEKVTLGYFALETREYQKKLFEGDYELVSFSGNFSLVDGKPFLHAHAMISDDQYRCFAGHFFGGWVSVTMEVFVDPMEEAMVRERDPEVGLNLLAI